MKKKWINIRIETKVREFQSKALLAYHLIDKGYGVVFQSQLGGPIKRFPKGIYFLNSIYADTYPIIRDIEEYGNKIYVLDEEGLVIRSKEEYLKRIDFMSLKRVSKFLCYGKEQYEILNSKFPSQASKFEITGNPRINLLNNTFDILEENDMLNIKQKYHPFILIVSNFGTVNIYGSNESKEDRYKVKFDAFCKMKLINNKDDEIDFTKRFDHYEKIFQSFLKLVKEISTEYPDFNIIIRPHPSEDTKIWKKVQSECPNIKVIYKGSLTEWIKSSQLVIQNGCTSAIESLFLNKTCISYRPYIDNKYDQLLPSKLSVNIKNQEEVINVIKDSIYSKENIYQEEYKKLKEMTKEYISFQDEDESIKEIIGLIENEKINSYYFNRAIYQIKILIPSIFLLNMKHKIKLNMAIISYDILRKLRLTQNNLFSYIEERIQTYRATQEFHKNKIGNLNVNDFENIFKKFNKIYDKNLEIKITRIDEDTFIVEKV